MDYHKMVSMIGQRESNFTLSISGYTREIVLCRGSDGTIYCTRNGALHTMDRNGNYVSTLYDFASNGYSGHNVHAAIILPSSTMIVALNAYNQTLTFLRSTNSTYTEWEVVNTDWNGGLLYHGWDVSPDGTLVVGEYPTHDNILTVRMWKVTNDGQNWSVVHTWKGRQGTITTEKQIYHIHTVCYDKYTGLFWVGTGDGMGAPSATPEEPTVYKYDGTTLMLVGEGTQMWRTCSFAFTPDYVLWGSDGGLWEDNHYQCYMVRLNRQTEELELVMPVDATMFNCEPLKAGNFNLFIASGTPNVIYLSKDGYAWTEKMRVETNPEDPDRYTWFYNYVDNKDGRFFAYMLGIIREDTDEPFMGTVIFDITD